MCPAKFSLSILYKNLYQNYLKTVDGYSYRFIMFIVYYLIFIFLLRSFIQIYLDRLQTFKPEHIFKFFFYLNL